MGRQGAMKTMRNRKVVAGLALLTLGLFGVGVRALAQDAQQGASPLRRAVRLSYVDGQVTVAQGSQMLADHATVNTPLFEGEQLTTADDGKAEIQFEDGSVARLAPDSSLTLSVLRGSGSSGVADVTVNSGLAYLEFQGGGQAGQISAHFGSSAATTSGFTVLRVDMDTPPGTVSVFSGNAHLQIAASPNGAAAEADIHGGEMITLNGSDPNQYLVSESIEPDSWDAWNSDRDEALTAASATQSQTPIDLGSGTGSPAWSDLSANGSWYDMPGQGYMWSPFEAANAGFDPYGNGNWMFTPGYGYVWASGYPWGYLPFQFGMWNYYGGFGWGWTPGVGGYSPWWGTGYYGGPNVGTGPAGYQPVTRPHLSRQPIGHRPMPVISVNRQGVIAHGALPARGQSTPVTIAGNKVSAIHPLPSQPVYSHQGFVASGNHSTLGSAGAQRGNGLSTHALPESRGGYLLGGTNGRSRSYVPGESRGRQGYTSQRTSSGMRGLTPSDRSARSYSSGSSSRSGRSSGGLHSLGSYHSSSSGGFHGSSGGGGFHGSSGGGSHGSGGGGHGGGHGGGGGGGGH